MIRNRLSELLSERGLKTSRVAKEVSIARSSLTSMIQNDSEMVRYDAIDKLCNYLNVSPEDFFEHIPLNFDFSFDEEPRVNITKRKKRPTNFDFNEMLGLEYFEFEMLVDVKTPRNDKINFDLELKCIGAARDNHLRQQLVFNISNEEENAALKKYVDELTPGLRNVLFKKITKQLNDYVLPIVKNNVENYSVTYVDSNTEKTLHNEILQSQVYLVSDIFREY